MCVCVVIFFFLSPDCRGSTPSAHTHTHTVSCRASQRAVCFVVGKGERSRRRSSSVDPAAMASGVKVCDEVVNCFTNMKVRKACAKGEAMKRKKAIMLVINKTKDLIILDEERQILMGDIQQGLIKNPFDHFMSMFHTDRCCYAIYDANYETKESKKEELIFIHWSPEGATIHDKLIYASSKDAVTKKFNGIKHEWQVNGFDDLADIQSLAAKLGSDVVAVESRHI